MYNSALKNESVEFFCIDNKEIDKKVFYNDMSKNYLNDVFKSCDCIYSEISWKDGYKIFKERSNNDSESYEKYLQNINRLVETLKIPTFIVCGKSHKKYFKNAISYPITLEHDGNKKIPNVVVYVWNYKYDENIKGTNKLIEELSQKFDKCLDFSCGYGEHLLKFKDFVGCDIDKNCITYLSQQYEERKLKR